MKISVFYAHVREAAAQAACDPKDLLPVLTGAGITGLEMDLNELGDLTGTKAMPLTVAVRVSPSPILSALRRCSTLPLTWAAARSCPSPVSSRRAATARLYWNKWPPALRNCMLMPPPQV